MISYSFKFSFIIFLLATCQISCCQCKGKTKKDKKVGVWDCGNFKYDYDEDRIIYTNLDTTSYMVLENDTWIKTRLERPPLYKDGILGYHIYITKNFHYPKESVNDGISGKFIVGVTIDTTGKPVKYRTISGLSESIDKEALRVIKSLPFNWYPAINLENKKVTAEIKLPVNLQLAR